MAIKHSDEPLINYEKNGHGISVYMVESEVSVRAGGEEILRTGSALLLKEQGYPPVYYFPISDVKPGFLEPSDRTSTCPYKGKANYYSLVVQGKKNTNAVWQYRDSTREFTPIQDYVAFYDNAIGSIDEVHGTE